MGGGVSVWGRVCGGAAGRSGSGAGSVGAGRRRDRNAREEVVSGSGASTMMVEGISKGGGAELRASMNADTQKAVRSIRNKING